MESNNRTKPGASRRSMVLLAIATFVGFLHHVDHVLRVDHSGWPFLEMVTPFTYSLSAYVVLFGAFLLRSRPLLSAAAVALLLVFTQFSHVVFELPVDQYTTWASGESGDPAHRGEPNLLGVESPLLGVLAAGISLTLSAALLATIVSLLADAFRARRHSSRPSTAANRPSTH